MSADLKEQRSERTQCLAQTLICLRGALAGSQRVSGMNVDEGESII